MSTNGGYRQLTRADLRGFNNFATDLILAAMDAGGVARVSSRGHCIVRGPKGATMSVSKDPSRANRSVQNQIADFRRVFGMEYTTVEKQKGKQPEATSEVLTPAPSFGDSEPTLECPVKDCEAVFVTEGARYAHCQKEHHPCREPGCQHVSPTPQGESSHYRIVHLDQSPKRGRGKRQREAAEAAAEPAASETVRVVTKVVQEGEVLKQIRHLLGADPRVAELEAENKRLRADLQAEIKRLREELEQSRTRTGELDAKLKLLKEALEL